MLATRRQGLIVSPGNPKGIQTLADLSRADIRFVNRQPGSGTRMLLDLMLDKAGIDGARITGYESGEFTHAAVAAYVASGMADAGVGVEAAAKRFDLGFVPLAGERYFFLCAKTALKTPALQSVIDTLCNPDFRNLVNALPGYDALRCGEVMAIEEAFPDFGRLPKGRAAKAARS